MSDKLILFALKKAIVEGFYFVGLSKYCEKDKKKEAETKGRINE